MSSANSSISPHASAGQSAHTTVTRAPAAFGITDLGLLLMACIWGVNFSVVKYGLQVLQPMTFTAIRMCFAVALLVIAALVARIRLPLRSDMIALVGLGLIGNGIYQFLFVKGLSQTSVGVTALIIASSPAWTAVISRVLGRERQTSRGWAGIGLQLAGVATVVMSNRALTGTGSAFGGTFFIVCSSIVWSLYSVLLQPYTARVHPLHLSVFTLLSGTTFLVAIASTDLLKLDFGTVVPSAWGAIAYSSIGAMIFAYMLYYRGIKILGPTRTAMYSNLQPAVAILVAWYLLREAPTVWQWVGTAFIMSGLLLSRTATAKVDPANELAPNIAREASPV